MPVTIEDSHWTGLPRARTDHQSLGDRVLEHAGQCRFLPHSVDLQQRPVSTAGKILEDRRGSASPDGHQPGQQPVVVIVRRAEANDSQSSGRKGQGFGVKRRDRYKSTTSFDSQENQASGGAKVIPPTTDPIRMSEWQRVLLLAPQALVITLEPFILGPFVMLTNDEYIARLFARSQRECLSRDQRASIPR
jgi:hypothetical protein